MAAEQNQWPETLTLKSSQTLLHYQDQDPDDGFQHDPAKYCEYVRLSRLQAEQEKREEAEDEREKLRALAIENGGESARHAERADRAEAALATERERLSGELLSDAGLEAAARASCQGFDAFPRGTQREAMDRQRRAFLLALSPSPVDGEECGRCGGIGKVDKQQGHVVWLTCPECNGTGRKQPDTGPVTLEPATPESIADAVRANDPEQQISDTLGEVGEALAVEGESGAGQEQWLILNDEGLAGLLDPDSLDDEADRTLSMKVRLLRASQHFSGQAVELILRPTRPDSGQEADR